MKTPQVRAMSGGPLRRRRKSLTHFLKTSGRSWSPQHRIRVRCRPPSNSVEYQRIYPPAAEEIFEMAKRDQAHRIEWEMMALRMSGRFTARGQYLGFAA